MTEVYWETCHLSKMERFTKIVNGSYPLNISAKRSILDFWQGCEYGNEYTKYWIILKQKGSFVCNIF